MLFGWLLFEDGEGTYAAGLSEDQVFSGLISGLRKACAEFFQLGSSRPAACDFTIAFDSSHARFVP